MDNLKSEKPYTLGFIIKQVSQQIQVHGFSNENYCIYSKSENIQWDQLCFIDKYPEIKNDEEVYPDFVQKENLELLYYGEQFEDILLNVMDQISIPSEKDYIEALIFFMENDEFKDF